MPVPTTYVVLYKHKAETHTRHVRQIYKRYTCAGYIVVCHQRPSPPPPHPGSIPALFSRRTPNNIYSHKQPTMHSSSKMREMLSASHALLSSRKQRGIASHKRTKHKAPLTSRKRDTRRRVSSYKSKPENTTRTSTGLYKPLRPQALPPLAVSVQAGPGSPRQPPRVSHFFFVSRWSVLHADDGNDGHLYGTNLIMP